MATKEALRKQLDSLVSLAQEQTRLHDCAREKLYQGLAGLYLWWLEAKQVDGFLEELYNECDIRTKQLAEENFVRVIRLVWRIDWTGARGSSLQKWSYALRKIDHEYQTNKDAYKRNAKENLVHFIISSGGVTGLAGVQFDPTDPSDSEKNAPKSAKRKELNEICEAKRKQKHLELAEVFFSKNANPLYSVDSAAVDIPTTDKRYALALVRIDSNSQIKILSFTEDQSLVQGAMIATYRRKGDTAPYVLRLLTEVIQTQALPNEFEQHRYTLQPISKFKTAEGQKMRQTKRLVIHFDQKYLLLSECRADCSVVTYAKPRRFLLKGNGVIFLNAKDRTFIEQSIIQKQDLAFFEGVNGQANLEETVDIAPSHVFVAKNDVTGGIRNLYFYGIDHNASEASIQATFDGKRTVATWNATIGQPQLRALYAKFLSRWLPSFGAKINQKPNQIVELKLDSKAFSIGYLHSRGRFDRYSQAIPLTKRAMGAATVKVSFLTKDIIPTLLALTQTAIEGEVKVLANEDMLSFEYRTEIASYLIVIPACTETGKRVKGAFVAYGGANAN